MEELEELYSDLSAFDADAAYEWGKTFFRDNLSRSVCITHDLEDVKFFDDRYYHAFRTSKDRARRAYAKDVVAVERIERIGWIRPVIEGRIKGVECWEVPLKVPEEGFRCFPGKRLYVCWEKNFIVWLEPLRKGGFKFSTSYVVHVKEIERYIDRGRLIWSSEV